MGDSIGAPINEAVLLLDKFAPSVLAGLRETYPSLESELTLGRLGGESNATLDQDRARIMIEALIAVKRQADLEVREIRSRMVSARNQRRRSQVFFSYMHLGCTWDSRS